ncbi:SMR family multidrug efflux transporter EbrB [Bacillus weihaiensis]|uniref:SMR family multidrug efflux transporter EbrB n=1 Tax=Bacillus weihaiensis TaxID=1547283 RepID=UPI002354B3E7|nr:multidrug efflux SMR transporter [Bacillus weihaiensis]
MKGLVYVLLAVITEVFGSTMLKLSDGFTKLWASIGVVVGFSLAFLALSYALKTISLSFAYATWSGLGTALTAIVGMYFFHEQLGVMKLLGLTLVIVGIVLLNTSNRTSDDKRQVPLNGLDE